MPRADDMPAIVTDGHVVPAKTNPIGVKGVGEAGTTASLAAIMIAIANAIPGGFGVPLDMPATREKGWRAGQEARAPGAYGGPGDGVSGAQRTHPPPHPLRRQIRPRPARPT